MDGYQGERSNVPTFQDHSLEVHVRSFAAIEDTSRIARLADGCLHEGAEVATAAKLVLDEETSIAAERLTPLKVDLALEVECSSFVGDVTWCGDESENDPKHEGVYGKEHPVVQEEPRPADDRRDDPERCCYCAQDEFGGVSSADDV